MSHPKNPVLSLVTHLLGNVEHGWQRFVAAVALAIGATASSVALMAVSAWLLARAAEHPPVMYLTAAAVGVRFFGISRGVLRYFERLVSHDLALRMQGVLRANTFKALSKTTLIGKRRGDLLIRVTADVEGIMDIVVRVVLPFCSASFVLIATSLILSIFNPLFAAVLLATSIISGIIVPWFAQRLTRNSDRESVPTRGELGDRVREIAVGAPDLVAYGADQAALDRLEAIDAKLTRIEGRNAWSQGLAGGIQMFFTGIAVAAAIAIGARAVADGTMLPVNLAVISLTPLALNETFGDLSKAAQTLTRAKAALIRVLSVLNAPPLGVGDRVVSPDSDTEIAGLTLENVSIGWPGGEPLLTDVNLQICPGEKVAITGTSGLGKTTLAATVMGLIPPMGGNLTAPAHISYLAQEAHIFATSLAENVKIGNKYATPDQIAESLALAGLKIDQNRVVGEHGATLSGGEAQRVSLARVLVADPKPSLVILDEPTEHLDHETADQLLHDLMGALDGVTMLVITHDPDLVARCGREVSLENFAVGHRQR